MPKKIIVIGGGMAGTSAAYHLTARGYEVMILEQDGRLGGRIHTEVIDGLAVEYGAEFVANAHGNLLAFLRKSGLYEDLYCIRPHPGVYCNEKAYLLSFRNFFNNNILSLRAKILLLFQTMGSLVHWRLVDPLHPDHLAAHDKKGLAEHYVSKTGNELFTQFVQPVLTSFFFWLPDTVQKTSAAVLLFFTKSLLLGGTFKFRSGFQRIPEVLAKESEVLLNHTVTKVEKTKGGTYVVVTKTGNEDKILVADGIVCATTATVIPRIFSGLTQAQRDFFGKIRYSSISYLGTTYPKHEVKRKYQNIALSHTGHQSVSSTLVLSPQSIKNTKPSITLFTVWAAAKSDEYNSKDFRKKISTEADELKEMIAAPEAKPLSTFSWGWKEALPVLEKGYFKQLKDFLDKEAKSTEPLVFAGDYLSLPFTEGAFSSGIRAAEQLDHKIRESA